MKNMKTTWKRAVSGFLAAIMIIGILPSAAFAGDMQIETSAFIYIFEFKVDGSAEEALRQIMERGYAERFAADHRIVYLIGANFSTATRTLTDWRIDIASHECPD